MGLSPKHVWWTEEADKILECLWKQDHIRMSDMLKVFPDRTDDSVCKRAKRMGLPNYCERLKPKIDYDYLKRLGITIEG